MSDRRPGESLDASWLRRGLGWWRSRGPATQAFVPGGYAWAVTIAPVASARGAGPVANVAALVGIGSLITAVALESRWPVRAAALSGWGLVASGIVTWVVAPEAPVLAFDASWGLAGMLGWALFAFVAASPARQPAADVVAHDNDESLSGARGRGPLLDRAVLGLAIGLTVALEVTGFRIEQKDRALLLRLVALAGGLGLVTTSSAILERYHAPKTDEKRKKRWRLGWGDVAWVAAACILAGAGATYELWRHP